MRKKNISSEMEFMDILNRVARSNEPTPTTKQKTGRASLKTTPATLTSKKSETPIINQNIVVDSKEKHDEQVHTEQAIQQQITTEDTTLSISSSSVSTKQHTRKKKSKKQASTTTKKRCSLQTEEEIEALSIFDTINKVSAPTAKGPLFTTVWVLKKKLTCLKILYPNKGLMYILDEIITAHLSKHKAKLKATYQQQMDNLF